MGEVLKKYKCDTNPREEHRSFLYILLITFTLKRVLRYQQNGMSQELMYLREVKVPSTVKHTKMVLRKIRAKKNTAGKMFLLPLAVVVFLKLSF